MDIKLYVFLSMVVLGLVAYLPPLIYGRRLVHLGGQGTYLSFDDGPSEITPKLLKVLDQDQLKGLFFLLGEEVDKRPDLVRQMIQEGHTLGLHGYCHTHPLKFFFISQYKDLRRGYRALENLGIHPMYYRAPHGAYTWASLYFCYKYHLKPIHWTGLVGDWELTDQAILLQRLKDLSGPGHLLVLHDGSKGKANPLAKVQVPDLVEDLKKALKTSKAPLASWRGL